MSKFAFGVTYDGAGLHGWQRQPDAVTVQGALEAALSQVANQTTTVTVAGRTDAGVHAIGQVASFSSSTNRSLFEWRKGMNALTPTAVHVNWVVEVPDTFHPRYHATARRYCYVYHDLAAHPEGGPERTHPLMASRVWGCRTLDADAMHRAAQTLLGEHDFTSFRAAGCQSVSAVRRINLCTVSRQGSFVVFEIEANAFLLHMVRNIARALHDVGRGELPMSLPTLLALRDRARLGPTAPPDGLYLVAVSYPDYALPSNDVIPFLQGYRQMTSQEPINNP